MWDALLNYGNQHDRWFEPMTEYPPTAELLSIYRQEVPADWRLFRRGLWFITHPPAKTLIQQGWKLHVSSTPGEAEAVLRKSMKVLFERDISFKFLLDGTTLSRTSAKRWPRGSSGKFITVYPSDDEEFVLIAKELSAALAGHHGPFILSDRRVPGSDNVFYRYGGFKALPRLQPEGHSSLMIADEHGNDYVDVRNPFYVKPDWATDPFAEPDAPAGLPELKDGRYAITKALSYTNAGGVYVGFDKHNGLEVVIKEARPHILVGQREFDAQQMLDKEFEILELLADTGHFAQPVDLFSEWEHRFLVEEYIDGQQMSSAGIAANPLLNRKLDGAGLVEYYQQQQRYWLALAEAISQAHERGVLIGDLSFTNVLIDTEGDRVVLIDLEAAIRVGQDEPIGLHTPGVSSPVAGGSGDHDLASDWYSFGALILGSIMLVNAAVGYQPDSLGPFLDSLTTDLALPPELPAIVLELMRPAEGAPVDPAAIRARLAAIDFADHPAWHRPVPIGQPATAAEGLDQAEIDRLVRASVDQIRATATPNRADRLFPSFFMAFETNPWNVSYGAAGVLQVLQQVDGAVSPRLRAWLLTADWDDPELCPPGLYSGTAGIAWVLDRLGERLVAQRALQAAMAHPLMHADPAILHGSAGIGLACLRLAGSALAAGDTAFAEQARAWARECGQRLADTAIRDERGAHWPRTFGPAPTTGEPRPQPIGYSNGASGIALFLLYLSAATGEPSWQELGRAGLDHDLSWAHSFEAGFVEFPSVTHDPAEEPKVVRSYWDEGTAGVATTLLRYRAVADDETLAEAWRLMRPDLCRKYVVLPQLAHGLAGIGMALQDAAELIDDADAGLEARRLAAGLARYAVPRENGVAWPSEQCFRESSDLFTGAAGVTTFLHRLSSDRRLIGRSSNANFVLDELLSR